MRFSWDENKDRILRLNKKCRGIGFEEVLALYRHPHYESVRSDESEQFISIGWVQATLYSVIFEERQDEEGTYRHLVTFWKSSKEEQKLYAKYTR
jgi:uncharacterized DUF497 family protein